MYSFVPPDTVLLSTNQATYGLVGKAVHAQTFTVIFNDEAEDNVDEDEPYGDREEDDGNDND